MAVLVILGSARRGSDTEKLVTKLLADTEYQVLNLLDHTISPYNYAHNYPANDTFQQAINELLQYDTLIFATPVYWYSMSGLMKNFLDRFTDLLKIAKDKGRQLRGKRLLLVAVSNSPSLPEGFEIPFRLSAEYLGMQYGGAYFCPAYNLNAALANTQRFLAALAAT